MGYHQWYHLLSIFTLLRVDEDEVKFESLIPRDLQLNVALCLYKHHGFNSMTVPEEEVSLF